MTTWTHTVTKMQRGNGGEWFAHRGTAYPSEAAAIEAARAFAAEQAAAHVAGTKIVVRDRARRTVRTLRWDGPTGEVVESRPAMVTA